MADAEGSLHETEMRLELANRRLRGGIELIRGEEPGFTQKKADVRRKNGFPAEDEKRLLKQSNVNMVASVQLYTEKGLQNERVARDSANCILLVSTITLSLFL